MGELLEIQDDLISAAEWMQRRLDIEQKMGHPDLEEHTTQLENLRNRIALSKD